MILIQINENLLKQVLFTATSAQPLMGTRGGIIPFAQAETKLLALLNKEADRIVKNA